MDTTLTDDPEIIREFLVESHESLSRLDQDLVELESHPQNANLLGRIFRTFHTIKGTCGFLKFSILEGIIHQAENLLSQLRDRRRHLTPVLVSLILETVDATRKVLTSIEATGKEGPLLFEDLIERLRVAAHLPAEVDEQLPTFKSVPSSSSALEPSRPADRSPADTNNGAHPTKVDGEDDKRKAGVPWDGVERRKISDGAKKREDGGKWDDDAEQHSAAADAYIRVEVAMLDKLIDLVGQLAVTRDQMLQSSINQDDAVLNALSQRLNLITSELQGGMRKTRMQPIGVLWSKFPRMVRDLAIVLGKGVQLVMHGAEREFDKTIIEAIKDPLMHLVRNSCDHGIEPPQVRLRAGKLAQGFVTLRADHEVGQVNIEVEDDGAGIDIARVKQKAVSNGLLKLEQAERLSDREALNLIFEPGFTTAETVTNLSGRGVGMDVVKSDIEKIGGSVEVFSRPGKGTTVRIKIPIHSPSFPASSPQAMANDL